MDTAAIQEHDVKFKRPLLSTFSSLFPNLYILRSNCDCTLKSQSLMAHGAGASLQRGEGDTTVGIDFGTSTMATALGHGVTGECHSVPADKGIL